VNLNVRKWIEFIEIQIKLYNWLDKALFKSFEKSFKSFTEGER